ncbi:MAG: fatty acid desaturase [Acidimicrobiia bacterium]
MNLLLGIAAGFVIAQVATLATTVYLHRGLAHRAITVHPAAAMVLRFFLWISTGMRAREWAAVHRKHHAASDTPGDPHSPIVLGFWRVQLANAALYRRTARDGETVTKYARDLPPDRLDKFLLDHAFLGLGVGVTISCLIFGWQTGLVAAVVHAVTYLMMSGAINAVGHTHGSRPHDNKATNGRVLALFTLGEGLHNNHHNAPTSARFSERFGEIDFGWWTVRLLAALRLAKIRQRTRDAVSVAG